MTANLLTNWMKKLLSGESRRQRRRGAQFTKPNVARWRPRVELLEDRLTPSVVTDLNDTAGSATDVTLRYAITNAANGTTITFASSIYGGTITLNSTLTINNNVTINGPGAALMTIGGNNAVKDFNIGSTAVAAISGLTIAHGSSATGAGIVNAGTLTLSNDTIANNTASAKGGGIANTGTVTLNGDTITNNAAVSGGGIYNSGTVMLSDSTSSGNTASVSNGSGIYTTSSGTLTVASAGTTPTIVNDNISTQNTTGLTLTGTGTTNIAGNIQGIVNDSSSGQDTISGVIGQVPTDYVGFTGASGAGYAVQSILNWTYSCNGTNINYSNGFNPNNLHLNGVTALSGTALEVTNGNSGEAGSAWTPSPVPIEGSTSTFQWTYGNTVTNIGAGFTFDLQNQGNTALGGEGSSLGYQGITGPSTSLQFNLYSNVSTFGVGFNGAINHPTDLTQYGINFHTHPADTFQATVTDSGSTLTVNLWDVTLNNSTTPNYTQTFALSTSSSVNKTGTGTLTLSNANTYAGTSTISGGTLIAAANNATGPATGPGIVVNTGGALGLANGVTLSGPISLSGSGPAGNGAMENISGNNTFAGAVTVVGTAAVGADSGNLNLSGNIGLASTNTLTVVGAGATTISGTTNSNGGSLGGDTTTGTATVTGPIVCTGNGLTLVSTGALTLSGNIALGSGTLNDSSSGQDTISGVVSQVPSAYVGFTGATGGWYSVQSILNWTYSSNGTNINYGNGFNPNNLHLNGNAALNGSALELTNGVGGEANSAWTPTPVPINGFTSTFEWTLAGSAAGATPADGITFALQNAGDTAVGQAGGSLAYQGITGSSIAVQFATFGQSTFGVGFNGAINHPTDLTQHGINFDNNLAHVYQVTVSESGSTLTVSIWDRTSNSSNTPNYTQTFTLPTPNSVSKTGTGTLTLSNGNTYLGATLVNGGTLMAAANNATGPTTDPGIVVGTGGALGLANGVTISEATSISGSGPTGNGAIESISGTNTFAAPITLTGAATIGADGGTLNVTDPTLDLSTYDLATTGAGNVVLASAVHGEAIPTDYVGFTGACGGWTSEQSILSWTYASNGTTINNSNGFASNNLHLNGVAAVNGTALELTNNNGFEASSAWTPTQVPVDGFTSTFRWTYAGTTNTSPADGFTFALQSAGNTALGQTGGDLGYQGITGASMAFEFDLWGGSTFGVGLNGAINLPTNLTQYGINFDSNLTHVYQATVTQGNGLLTVSLWDTTTNPATNSPNYTYSMAMGGNTLTKGGAGTLTLSANDSIVGPIAINAGKLVVNGVLSGGNITVNSSGALGGAGTVPATTVESGGTYAPGDPTTLTAARLSLTSGANFDEELAGATTGTYDKTVIQSGGGVTLGGATLSLAFVDGFAPALGQSFTIIGNQSGTAVNGTFSQGSSITYNGYTFSINYAGNAGGHDVVLTVTSVPTPVPTVTGLSPATGPAAGGTSVSITGTGFTSTSTVAFGSIPATNVTFLSTTSLTAVDPAGTGVVDVTITTPGGTSALTSADLFTYITPLAINPDALSGGDVSVPYNRAITITGGLAPYTALAVTSYNDGGTGLAAPTVNLAGGTITFNSTPSTPGTVTFTVNVTDTAGSTLTQNFSVIINPALTIAPTALPTGNAGFLYNPAIAVNNGTTPYTILTVTGYNAGGTGLAAPTVSTTAGTVTFNSTPSAAGTVTFTVNATDTAGGTLTENYSLTILSLLTVAPATLPAGDAGSLYNSQITVLNGIQPYTTFTVTGFNGGTTGLTAGAITTNSAAGTIIVSGIPTAPGSAVFTVNVTDSTGATVTQNYTLTINPAPAITTTTLPNWTVNQPFSQIIEETGGTTPITFAVSAGSLPTGLSLNSGTGAITGTPTTTNGSPFSFAITATDAISVTASQAYTLTIDAAPAITTTSLPNWTVNQPYSQTIAETGGTAPISFTVSAGSLPTGLSLNSSTGAITGTPTTTSGSPFSFTITATDAAGATATHNFTLTVLQQTFQVLSTTLLPGDNGFLVTFNAGYNIAQLSLYTGDSGHILTTRSVQITGPNGATFGGSDPDTLRFNAVPVDSTDLELILTGLNHVAAAKVLAAGTYTVTLDGGSNAPAFRRLSDGAFLDGNGDETLQATDNYTTTQTVSPILASTAVVSIGDLVAGPGQTSTVPLVLSGGAGSVSNTTAVGLTIVPPADGAYTVTGFTPNSTLSGVSVTFNPATGLLTLTSSAPFATTDSPLLLGNFTIGVSGLGNGGTAPAIDTKTPINITVTSVLDPAANPKPFVGVNGFHVSAYPGNLVAPIGIINSSDVSQLQGIIITSVRALALYPNIDPLLLADVNQNGSVNETDVSQLQSRILGLPSTIPPLPLGASGVAVNGADPVLFVGSTFTPNALPANLGNLTPGSTMLVPVSVFVTDPYGVNVTAAEAAFGFDPKVFTLNGVSAGGSMGSSPFSIAFAEVGPGEVNVIGSSSNGPNLAYGQTATLFLISLTVRSDAPVGNTVFNLMSSENGLQTGLQDNQGRNLVLSPAPENRAGDNLDGAITVHSGTPAQRAVGGLSGTTATGDQKQTASVTALAPAAWEQLTTLLFEAAANPSVLNGSNGSLAMAAAVPVTDAAEGKKQGGDITALEPVAWEQLTTRLFEAVAQQPYLNGNPTVPLWCL